jgi:ribosomal protein S18 acetylase RimI-like enzyme
MFVLPLYEKLLTQMELISIDNKNYPDYKDQLLQLYLNSFSSGLSAQSLDPKAIGQYLDSLLAGGYGIVVLEEEKVFGALLATPLSFDELIPDKINQNFLIEDCVYIAEMMVTENARGKGLGKQMLLEFIQTVDKKRFKHVFIRVWVENIPAISLYRSMGYQDYAYIDQRKTKPNSNETFVMHKVYLYRNLSQDA